MTLTTALSFKLGTKKRFLFVLFLNFFVFVSKVVLLLVLLVPVRLRLSRISRNHLQLDAALQTAVMVSTTKQWVSSSPVFVKLVSGDVSMSSTELMQMCYQS